MYVHVIILQTATVKEGDRLDQLPQYSGEVDPTKRRKCMAIGTKVVHFSKCILYLDALSLQLDRIFFLNPLYVV